MKEWRDIAIERMTALYAENKKITDGNYDKSLAVKCINGTFVGKKEENVIAYRGIPFVGKQPVGEYRWKAPVEFTDDDGVYEAYHFGKVPLQGEDLRQIGSLYPASEECLHLNVWKSADESTEKKPVIVWIHGGAYEVGSTAEPREDGTAYVNENPDIVFASIEYRLGIFGFFHMSHLPDGEEYKDAQNLGLMDQLMALKWIHENIALFGGDPENVTIIGESAGAGSCLLLPLVEGSHKYFKRVIAQSGSVSMTRTTEEAIECTNSFMENIGKKTVADLQKMDTEELLKASELMSMCMFPEKDGKFLPTDPYDAYLKGAAKDIDILQGCNKDELCYVVSAAGVENAHMFGAEGKVKKMTQLTEKEKALVDSYCKETWADKPEYSGELRLVEQIAFVAPMFRMSENQTKGGGKSYSYFFTPESSLPLMRCAHTIEIAVVFNHQEETLISGRRFDETFAKTVRRMWIQFAKTGDPSLTADISPDGKEHIWPLYDQENKQLMILDEFNIHPEKAAERDIVDWDRTYFLTKYYFI